MTTSFKELCLDTDRPGDVLGQFWADLTGCALVRPAPGEVGDVAGAQEGMGIAICPVPEPRTGKTRVHLDVSVADLTEVTERGGTVVDDESHAWAVCADPEGNAFCAFVREGALPAYRVFEVVVDSADPQAIAGWWAERFGVRAENEGQPWWWVSGVPGFPTEGSWFGLVFAPVPEPKTVKNRMHWDVYGDPQDFLDAGATFLWDVPGRTRAIGWTVLADPEGNEFCVFPTSDRAEA